MSVFSTLIQGAAALGKDIIGPLISNKGSKDVAKLTNEANLEIHQMDNQFNERMAEKANLWNIDQWNREVTQQDANWKRDAEYNSASAQVQRYRDAGLNPTIMMNGQGAGTVSSQNVPHVTSSQAASSSPIPMQSPTLQPYNFSDSLNDMINANLQLEQLQSLKLDNARKEQQNVYEIALAKHNASKAGFDANTSKLLYEIEEASKDDSIAFRKLQRETQEEIKKEKKEAAEYQRLVTAGIEERLAAELTLIKNQGTSAYYQGKGAIKDVIAELEKQFGTLPPAIKAIAIAYLNGK